MASDDQACALLEKAIDDGEVRPVFQPIVCLADETLVAFEVLARWKSTTFGDISPLTFIPYAEKNDLIDGLTRKLIHEACCEAVHWLGNFQLCFNISPLQFHDLTLYNLVVGAIRSSGFDFNRVVLEMTERDAVLKQDIATSVIEEFLSIGIKLSLDDFGSGYGDFVRLNTFPFKYIKIDASLVEQVDCEQFNRNIITSIINLGKSVGYEVVAEGVETEQQAEILRKLGCHMAQGWLFSRVLEAKDAALYAEKNF